MRKRLTLFLFCLSISYYSKAQTYAAQWGFPPCNWTDFKIGVTQDDSRAMAPIIATAKAVPTGLHYKIRYINEGVDITRNWYSHQPSGGLATNMITSANAIGMNAAFNIYMLQEDGGADIAINNMNNLSFMQQYFWNVRDVAQKANGNKCVFIIEPDTWGYLIKKNYGAGPTSAGGTASTRPSLVFCNVNNLGYPELASLPNTMSGMARGIIAMIRKYAPDAYIGFHTNHWAVWSNGATGPSCLGANAGGFYACQAGMPFWSYSDIDVNANFQIAWYTELFGGTITGDRGDFIVVEKYGLEEGYRWGIYGWATPSALYYDNTAYLKWRYWSKKLGQGLNLPMLGWQIPVGNTSLPNTDQHGSDGFMENFFANKSAYICDGFIGLFAGPGTGHSVMPSNGVGSGDDGWFFKNLRTQLDPGRPYSLKLSAAPCSAPITPLPGCNTLPVDFIDVTGVRLNDHANKINWSVANEVNVDHYAIECSERGDLFKEVGTINYSGTRSTVGKNYQFVDNDVMNPNLYYRIKEVDLDGSVKYSNVISVLNEQTFVYTIYPNPITSQTKLTLLDAKDRTVLIRIVDMYGRQIRSEGINLESGVPLNYYLDKELAKGAYFLSVMDEDSGINLVSEMLVKQ